MDFLNIKRAHIVGDSIGGTIALQLASSYPDYIKSLIYLNLQLQDIINLRMNK